MTASPLSNDLHTQIMNLPDGITKDASDDPFIRGYRFGHRDARHAAAELVCASLAAAPPALTDTLEDNVRYLLDQCPHTVRDLSGDRTGARGEEDLSGSLAITFLGMQHDLSASPERQNTEKVHQTLAVGSASTAATPSAQWREKGEPDPHGNRYDCERAALAMGDLSDDELANGAFMNYDRFDIDAIMSRKPGYHPPIAWMTAVKDRIRWLSRKLEASGAQPQDGMTPADRALMQQALDALAYIIDDLELRSNFKRGKEKGVVDIGDGAYRQGREAVRALRQRLGSENSKKRNRFEVA